MPITSSPGFHIVTRSPTASTIPENSSPGISRAAGRGFGYRPITCRRSARLSAVARMRTTTSSGPPTGSGTSSIVSDSGPPWERRTTARITAVSQVGAIAAAEVLRSRRRSVPHRRPGSTSISAPSGISVERAAGPDDGRDAELASQHGSVAERPTVGRHDRPGQREDGVVGRRRARHDEDIATAEPIDRLFRRIGPTRPAANDAVTHTHSDKSAGGTDATHAQLLDDDLHHSHEVGQRLGEKFERGRRFWLAEAQRRVERGEQMAMLPSTIQLLGVRTGTDIGRCTDRCQGRPQ